MSFPPKNEPPSPSAQDNELDIKPSNVIEIRPESSVTQDLGAGTDKKSKVSKYLLITISFIAIIVIPLVASSVNKEKEKVLQNKVENELSSIHNLIENQQPKENFGATLAKTQLVNPELSWFQRTFCRGLRRSLWLCPDDPIHPYVDYMRDAYGVEYKDWLKQHGVKQNRNKIPGTTSIQASLKSQLTR